MRARGKVEREDFEATLVFVAYSSRAGSTRGVIYRDIETDEEYRISNFAIEKMIKFDQLRPVVTATWAWTNQGNTPVIKPVTVTYTGLGLPE